MACKVTKGRNLLPCKNPSSGIRAIYFIPYLTEKILDTNVTKDDTGLIVNTLTDLNLYSSTNLTGVNVFKYSLKGENSYDEESTAGGAFKQTLNVETVNITKEMQYQVKLLAIGYNRVVVERMDGQYILVGKDNGTECLVKYNIAAALDAVSSYKLTISGMEVDPAYFLDADAVIELEEAISGSNNV